MHSMYNSSAHSTTWPAESVHGSRTRPSSVSESKACHDAGLGAGAAVRSELGCVVRVQGTFVDGVHIQVGLAC
jgi:hypothetical protein